jgi:hypothetical protein
MTPSVLAPLGWLLPAGHFLSRRHLPVAGASSEACSSPSKAGGRCADGTRRPLFFRIADAGSFEPFIVLVQNARSVR